MGYKSVADIMGLSSFV